MTREEAIKNMVKGKNRYNEDVKYMEYRIDRTN